MKVNFLNSPKAIFEFEFHFTVRRYCICLFAGKVLTLVSNLQLLINTISSLIITITKLSNLIGYQLP